MNAVSPSPRFRLPAAASVCALLALAAACGAVSPQARAQSSDATGFIEDAEFSRASGETVYRTICQGCHMADGRGATGAGAYPSLIDNPKLGAAAYVAYIVLNGNGGMPGFSRMLTDEQVIEVTEYVRTHFGNDYRDELRAEDMMVLHP